MEIHSNKYFRKAESPELQSSPAVRPQRPSYRWRFLKLLMPDNYTRVSWRAFWKEEGAYAAQLGILYSLSSMTAEIIWSRTVLKTLPNLRNTLKHGLIGWIVGALVLPSTGWGKDHLLYTLEKKLAKQNVIKPDEPKQTDKWQSYQHSLYQTSRLFGYFVPWFILHGVWWAGIYVLATSLGLAEKITKISFLEAWRSSAKTALRLGFWYIPAFIGYLLLIALVPDIIQYHSGEFMTMVIMVINIRIGLRLRRKILKPIA